MKIKFKVIILLINLLIIVIAILFKVHSINKCELFIDV